MYLAQMMRRYDDSWYGYNGHDSWVGPVFMLIVMLIIAGVAIYLIRTLADNNRRNQTDVRDPLDYARERYARGEITKEELADIKKELK